MRTGGGISIGRMMIAVALIAANLALAQALPPEFRLFPTIWVLAAVPDYVAFRKLVQGREMGAFDHAFLIALVPTYVSLANLAAAGRIHPLGVLVRCWEHLSGAGTVGSPAGGPDAGEIWMACALSVAIAMAAGWAAARVGRRTGWDVAAFLRRSLVGLGAACLLITAADAAGRWPETTPAGQAVRISVMALCMVAGGSICRSRLRSAAAATCEGPSRPAAGIAPR
ncbi:hypothetical protein OJF2_05060 [Aquisphaera giovannonii]|uniref:Uncharacterized protein n=1 Tax=Aquisphaera giovannonii TaxID=406548 RepID=A0A5B9VVS2_9BACT|nr:hypothetical protein [Aquisphaera giovannonii]QEH32037.1 hypothetical protein OJF2_05060 [Aquisphaera giovannonii]